MTEIDINVIGAEVQAMFEAASNSGWDWKHKDAADAKTALRAILFVAQKNRCFYCRRRIKDVLGHSELDHVLPKDGKGGPPRWTSNARGDRKCTPGYASFKFNPFNLVLACKACNTAKGTYDCRSDRAIDAIAEYVLDDEDYYEWVHPFVHSYADHIVLLKDLIYQPANSSAKGDAVISACGLEKVGAVERNACELKVKEATNIKRAFLLMLEELEFHNWDYLIGVVHRQFPAETLERIREIGEEVRAYSEAA